MLPIFKASAAGIALVLAATPGLAAQGEPADEVVMVEDAAAAGSDEAAELAAMSQMFAGLFTTEPLTAEQAARLPAANRLIAKVIPEGTMAEMMDKLLEGVLGPMMALAPNGAATSLAKQIGTDASTLDLTDEQANELASLFDPAWAERQQREAAMVPELMKEVMGVMEPGMRKAMAELYAIRFSDSELAQLDGFFSTPTGSKYARESFLMASDPRIMASTMESMPALIGVIGNLEARMAERTADLPLVRSFADLSPEERAKVAQMTGYSIADIEANLDAASFSDEEAP